ncbi:MAG: hypothetical protein H0T11_07325 [Chthoniobacterales bacterium]|nr:hypothetical protein [Chthoniobacterales bacterium]
MHHLSTFCRGAFVYVTSRAAYGLLTATVTCWLASTAADAQEVALPEASPEESAQPSVTPAAATAEPAPTVAPSAPSAPIAPIAPPLLIPPDILPMPDPTVPPTAETGVPSIEELDEQLKPKPLSPATENYRLHIEWRKLRNQAQNDPAVKAALAKTDRAPTDLQKRILLLNYFNVFFDKMIAIKPDMKDYLNDRRREHINALPQPRVRPLPTPAPSIEVTTTTSRRKETRESPTPSSTPTATPSRRRAR